MEHKLFADGRMHVDVGSESIESQGGGSPNRSVLSLPAISLQTRCVHLWSPYNGLAFGLRT